MSHISNNMYRVAWGRRVCELGDILERNCLDLDHSKSERERERALELADVANFARSGSSNISIGFTEVGLGGEETDGEIPPPSEAM